MICVTSNGTFVDILGPYQANQNDSTIMRHIFDSKFDEIMNILRDGDVMLLDRGFRDCENMLKDVGFVVRMPEFVNKSDGTGQLTTIKANKSRIVTANRFAVEARNGNIKTIWKIFDTKWSSYDLPHMIDDYRIGAALINAFYKKIIANKGNEVAVARSMLSKVESENKVFSVTKTQQFQNQLKHFVECDAEEVRFPTLTYDELKSITLGIYQVKQMHTYCVEHLRSNNNSFNVFVCPDSITTQFFKDIIDENNLSEPVLILLQLKSRFRANAKHRTFVLADVDKSGSESITGFSCSCRHGLRTVGCCSHTITAIGYLGYFKNHIDELKEISSNLNTFFVV